MKLLLNVLSIAILCWSCQNDGIKISVTNPSDIDLTDKAITVQRSSLPTLPEGAPYPILVTVKGDTLAAQLDDTNNDGSWDELFWVMDLKAGEQKDVSLQLSKTDPNFERRTSVRAGKRESKDSNVEPITGDTIYSNQVHAKLGYEPYQTDGPSFENDKVGFRHYFDGRHSKDLFGKRASYMSPETVGINAMGSVEDNYHVMEDWGRDILAVGNSVGIGGINLMIGDSLSRMGCLASDTTTNIEFSVFNIDVEGPVRSIVRFEHHHWKPFDRDYEVHEQVKIWPGMYAFQNNVFVNGLKGDESLLVGLVNSNTEMPLREITVGNYIVLLTHDKQTYEKQWWLGLGLILPKDSYLGYGKAPDEGAFSKSFYGKLSIKDGVPVTYYAVGCWELSEERFKDPKLFEDYMVGLAQQLDVIMDVKVN